MSASFLRKLHRLWQRQATKYRLGGGAQEGGHVAASLAATAETPPGPLQSPWGRQGHMGNMTLVKVENQDVWGKAVTKKR